MYNTNSKMTKKELSKSIKYYRILKTWDCNEKTIKQIARQILGLEANNV